MKQLIKGHLRPGNAFKQGLVFFVFAAWCTIGYGQEKQHLSGRITDNHSRPVAGASIVLLNTNLGAFSDSGGYFRVDNLRAGRYTARVTAVGYAAADQDIDLGQQSGAALALTLFESSTQLGGVLVTAEKREALLQKIPAAITSLSALQVSEYRIWNSQDLTAIVPNLYSGNSGDQRNVASIRGITTTAYDPAVATYVDGVNQFTLDTYITQLFDVERIEVLRGPQGTLYGRNAMGGVINIITRQPSDHPEVFLELSVGNYGQERLGAGLRAPLVKGKLFLGASGLYEHLDGYYSNKYNNAKFDRQHSLAGNYYLKWIASQRWQVTLNLKHEANRNNGAFPLAGSLRQAFASPHQVNQNALTTLFDNTLNSSLSVAFNGPAFNFTSQTAYQSNYRYYENPIDGDFSPYDAVTIIDNYGKPWNQVKAWTQEFKLTAAPGNKSPFTWTVGAYLFYQDNPSKQATHFGRDASLVGSQDSLFSLINTTKSNRSGLALYGQGSFAINKKLSIVGGLRYDYERDREEVRGQYAKDPSPDPIFDTQPDTAGKTNYSAVSPKLGLNLQLRTANLVYLSYSRGFRVGGLTPLSSDPSQPPLYAYKPEYSNSIELGSKNSLLHDRLRINATIFYTTVTDVQVPTLVLPDAITITRNAGQLTSKGFELEVATTPVKGLEGSYNFGYTHATYDNLNLSQNGSARDYSGKRQIFTPELTSLLALQYSYAFASKLGLHLVVRGEWSYLGKEYFDLANKIAQSPYSLFNARAGVNTKQFGIYFWGRNLTNKNYIAYAYDFGAVHLGNPLTYGLTLTTRF